MPHPNDTPGRTAVRNSYHCVACDHTWTDIWTCGCDDECSRCGRDISPFDSESLDEDPDTIDGVAHAQAVHA